MSPRRLPAFRLAAEPISDEARRLLAEQPDYIDASIGERHLLGGDPSYLQGEEWPDCPSCGERMTFYAQLDSLPSVEFALADAGLIYVFVCFGCFQTTALLQSG